MSSDPATPGRRHRLLRGLRHVAAAVALLAGCALGGVAATTLFPGTADTINYSAQLRLSVNPVDISTIHAPTIFGDINLEFSSILPAPGILANVQVREQITDLLAQPKVSIKALQPSDLELTNAAKQAAVALGIRFGVGSLLVALAALAVYAVWRHRRPPARRVATAGGCWVLACGLTGLSVWATYQPEQLTAFRTTSVLGAVQRNADLLSDVETRAEQTTPYLKNLLALSTALQDKYAPQNLSQPVAAKVLLVSDIHGGQQYPLMRTIVKNEHIDAVVDAGDLLNFGSVAEGEAAGLFDGIASLGVPYLFVRGNHDARYAGDPEVLTRLAKIPNVVLLQPNRDTYQVETVAGVRIAGFNDPRWFGDDNHDNAAKQVPARDEFVRTFADRPVPDLVVSHEPGALEGVDRADLLVHGHMHTPQLDGNVIGIGTFTGGGTFSHFLEGTDHEEAPGQPSAFDIATFGQDCRLTSLARYQYRNVVEGRPAYDDVTLINGARIETRPAAGQGGSVKGGQAAAPQRTCSPSTGVSTEAVPALAAP